jgi:hypothetical protein
LETAGAAVGAVGTSIVLAYFGAATATSGGEDPGLIETVVGAMAGSVLGSAIGVSVAGGLTHDTGKFGSALVGSAAGLLTFFLMMPSLDADYASFFLAFWGLPTAGAVLGYCTSRGNGSRQLLEVPLHGVRLSMRPHREGVALRASVAF